MKKFISAVTSLAMAATMASSIAPSISAADATKTFSLKAYAEAGSKYDAMGDKVTISKDDIAAGDVTVPCAVYLDEATPDSETISVQFTINSDSADVKNVTMKAYGPSDNYFSEAKTFTVGGESTSTKKFVAFAGSIDMVLESYKGAGGAVIGCDPKQEVAGAKNYFVGYSWTNNGKSYTWSGEKSSDHPVMVFDVTFPKGTAAGDYKIEYCKYNTDTTGEHDNPSNMIETKSRYTEAAGNLKLNEMTITVEGVGGDTTTTEKKEDTTTTSKKEDTTTTTTTVKKEDTTTTTVTATPDKPDADVVFDFGNYTAAKGDKVKVNVKADSKGKGIAAMDVVFKLDKGLTLAGIGEESPAFSKSVMANLDILGANFTAIENGSGDPVVHDADQPVFVLVVKVADDAADGVYKVGFGDKVEVFKDATKNKFSTAAINGNITVGNPPVTTEKKDDTTTTTTSSTKKDDTTTTTVTTTPVKADADVVFDFGNYTAAKGDKVKVNVKADSKGKGIAAMDVVFKLDKGLTLAGIGEESPAFSKSVMANLDILGANFTAIENGSGDPVVHDADQPVFVLVVKVADDAADGVYKVGFGDKVEVFKDATKNKFTTAAINGNITVGNPVTTTEKKDDTTTTSSTKKDDTTTTSSTKSDDTTTTSSTKSDLTPNYGDVNVDGEVNVADVVLLNKWLNKNSDYNMTEQGKVNADADQKDAAGLTAADSDAIINFIVGNLTALPRK